MNILADIGGTHARFAVEKAGQITSLRKYAAADFLSLEAALAKYCKEEGIEAKGSLQIATAAYPDEKNIWRFVNRNKWVIDAASLKKAGWQLDLIVNDFEAATWALKELEPEDAQSLKPGKPNTTFSRCLLGPGTGLGLGYLVPVAGQYHVQRTHGGHMLAAGLNEEHFQIIQTVQRLKSSETIPVFENLVSGPGLYNIYTALCFISGKKPQVKTPEEIFDHVGVPEIKESLRLFHEFFGLFAQTAVITGHAYGGLYLTGGVLDLLETRGLFDFPLFEKFFVLPGVESVTHALEGTPVFRITHPALAMAGLLHAREGAR
jgi:glucokinase